MGISSAVPNSDRARAVGISVSPGDNVNDQIVFLPQRVAVLAQGADNITYSSLKQTYTNSSAVGAAYGYGTPAHLIAKQLLPDNRDGINAIPMTIYPLQAAPSATPSTGSLTPTGTQSGTASYRVLINDIPSEAFVIEDGELGTALEDRVAQAINAVLDMPVIATAGADVITLVSKWSGSSANGVKISVDGPANGIVWAIVQPTGGTINPDITPALNQFGNVWESMVLNSMEISDEDTLDRLQTFGLGRWVSLNRKPFVAFTGNTIADVTAATAVSSTRRDDYINCQLPCPGSPDLPFVVAARQLARIVVMANSDPAHDYGSLQATGLTPGADSEQWDYIARDAALKRGSSSIESRDGVVHIKDVITFYNPVGNTDPEYRYVCDIVKLQNVLYNLDRRFDTPEWDGAPLLPDGDFTTSRTAKFPSTARLDAGDVVRQLGLAAILADVAETKRNIQASINDQNPKRLDLVVPVKLVGNVNIFSVDVLFSFLFGQTEVRGV